MIKYYMTGLALKAFSSCAPARRVYRGLGNLLGAQRRSVSKMPFYYYERVQRNVAAYQKASLPAGQNTLLELGTGWVHWEALTLRLFFDFEAVLYDVWDNRQLNALKSYVRQLGERFGQDGFLRGCDFNRAWSLICKIEAVSSFEELYQLLGFQYVVDPAGLMDSLPRSSFDIVISAGVMEHIPAETAPQFVSNMASLMKPGALGIHSINITDHLYLYDRLAASPKQYLTYSESAWRLWFQNGVQYINRIQRSAWLEMFAHAGFKLVEEAGAYANLCDLRVHARYQGLSREDINCTTLDVIVRKV